jgi:DNA-binding response OmpR family regulator
VDIRPINTVMHVIEAGSPGTGTQTVNVVIVEDAPEFSTLLTAVLRSEGFSVRSYADGESAIAGILTDPPDVVLLDLVLPGIDGVEVCRRIRPVTDAYVIFLTARDDEVDKVVGLAVGGDDYMTKPFSPRELVARIRAMMRRPRQTPVVGVPAEPVLRHLDLTLDPESREVLLDDQPVPLTRIEFELLRCLMRRPGAVVARPVLLVQVWGENWFGDSHVVDVHVANLRRKVDANGRSHIRTVRGVGYKLVTT